MFKNDINIFRATGNISTEKFTSYLTFDPVVRLKFAAANQTFNWARKLMPTAKGEAAALIAKATKVIKNPSNYRAVEDLIATLPEDKELKATVKQLAIEYARFGYPEAYPKVKVYRSGVPGRSNKPIDGKLGKGIYWTTDRKKALERGEAIGGKVVSEKILPARIADDNVIADLLGEEIDISSIKDKTLLVEKLKDAGFTGLTSGDDIVMFK